MSVDTTNFTQVGFWGMLAYLFVRDAAIPLVMKIFPQKVEAQIRQGEREVAALEKISETLTAIKAGQDGISSGQEAMIRTLNEHSKALAVLVDRRATRKSVK